MMTDSVEGQGSNGGGFGNQVERWLPSLLHRMRLHGATSEELAQARVAAHDQARAANAHARAYGHALTYARLRAYFSMTMKASAALAVLLSTAILLGGYVQSLGKQDFFCIMAITVIQAAGIFQEWENNAKYFLDLGFTIMVLASNITYEVSKLDGLLFKKNIISAMKKILIIYIISPIIFLFTGLLWCVLLLYMFGPSACAGISSWRIVKLNHGDTNRDANMMAALNIFYSLIIFQGTIFWVLIFTAAMGKWVVPSHLLAGEQLPEKWGKDAMARYISDISARCRKDSLSIKGRDLIKYGAELLDSESQEDYLYGARLLSYFVSKGEDVSWVLLPSRHRIQRLIDSLMISSSSLDEPCVYVGDDGRCLSMVGSLDDKKEIRELAATIMADVAAHIDDLSKYPRAMRCISSLLQDQEETTQMYRNRNSKQPPDDLALDQRPIGLFRKFEQYKEKLKLREIEMPQRILMMDQQRIAIREHRHRNKREGGTSNKLVQQGLTILERLASNSDDNRRLICGAPGVLPKITAPLYSATLIEDIKTKAWADIVTRCLQVLYQLIRAPGRPSRRLRGQIFSKHKALSNLKIILLQVGNDEADHQELQMVSMKILTELALDLSIKHNENIQQVLIIKQLQLFLANGDGAALAGRTLLYLSTKSERISAPTMTTQNSIIGRLTEILDDENITRRTVAAEIMANLYAHYNVDNTTKEILPKVLRKIMSIKTKSQERKVSAGLNNPAASGDEENQGNSVSTYEERQSISTDSNDTETEEISDQEREEQEAFLSLAQVICDKLDSADLDGAIQSAVEQNNLGSDDQRREAFVEKLKTIIDNNCHPVADSLRIVKLCSRIAKSVMQCEEYVVIFRNKGFKGSLSKASKTMSELESCMLFVGTDFGPKKTVRPLFSEIEKSFGQI